MISEEDLTLQRRCSDFVNREVLYCVSGLITRLQELEVEPQCEELSRLLFQEDYQPAAEEAGWELIKIGSSLIFINDLKELCLDAHLNEIDYEVVSNIKEASGSCEVSGSSELWQQLCITRNIEPEYRDVFEYWLVTSYLAELLTAQGEVVEDIYGLDIWGRTTTGQMIASDYVIETIVKQLATQS